jgi:hypothetical protein
MKWRWAFFEKYCNSEQHFVFVEPGFPQLNPWTGVSEGERGVSEDYVQNVWSHWNFGTIGTVNFRKVENPWLFYGDSLLLFASIAIAELSLIRRTPRWVLF